jgi:hypothetical protein
MTLIVASKSRNAVYFAYDTYSGRINTHREVRDREHVQKVRQLSGYPIAVGLSGNNLCFIDEFYQSMVMVISKAPHMHPIDVLGSYFGSSKNLPSLIVGVIHNNFPELYVRDYATAKFDSVDVSGIGMGMFEGIRSRLETRYCPDRSKKQTLRTLKGIVDEAKNFTQRQKTGLTLEGMGLGVLTSKGYEHVSFK